MMAPSRDYYHSYDRDMYDKFYERETILREENAELKSRLEKQHFTNKHKIEQLEEELRKATDIELFLENKFNIEEKEIFKIANNLIVEEYKVNLEDRLKRFRRNYFSIFSVLILIELLFFGFHFTLCLSLISSGMIFISLNNLIVERITDKFKNPEVHDYNNIGEFFMYSDFGTVKGLLKEKYLIFKK